MHDLIIIGGGPAAVAAAIYTIRNKLNLVVLTEDIGGQMLWSSDIQNWPGTKKTDGGEMAINFEEHMKSLNIDVKQNDPVESLTKEDDKFIAKTKKGQTYESKAVIITSGKQPRKLNVPGEDKLAKKGVAYCATCDAPLFAGKEVVVVGGANSALDAVLKLKTVAKKISLININPEVGGEEYLRDSALTEDVDVYNNAKTNEILGDAMVEGIKFEQNGDEKTLNVQGVFIEIGQIPNVDFIKMDIEKNEWDEIKADAECKTNIEGCFAAGDVTDVPEKQIVVAAGQGAIAGLSAFKFLGGKGGGY